MAYFFFFFNICVYLLSSVSLVSASTETVGMQKYQNTSTNPFRQNCAQCQITSIPMLVNKAEVDKGITRIQNCNPNTEVLNHQNTASLLIQSIIRSINYSGITFLSLKNACAVTQTLCLFKDSADLNQPQGSSFSLLATTLFLLFSSAWGEVLQGAQDDFESG